MADSDRFKLDPTIVEMVGESKKENYATALSKMFSDLGDIANESNKQEQEKLDLDTKKLNYQSVSDQLADEKTVSEYIASDAADLKSWLEDNNKTLKTPQWQLKAGELSDKRMDTVWDESLNAHENYLKENNLFLTDDGHLNMDELRMQLAKDPQNLDLAQAFERKYGTKLNTPPKDKSSLTITEQYKIADEKKKAKENQLLEKDLIDVKANYEELFGKPMSAAQEIAYKKKGELPYYKAGSGKDNQKEDAIVQITDLKDTMDFLNNLDEKEIEGIVNYWTEGTIGTEFQKAFDLYTPRQRQIIQKISKLNAVQMHKLYGAALTKAEATRAKQWNLDRDSTSDPKEFKANLENWKELIDKKYVNIMHNVHMDDSYKKKLEDARITVNKDEATTNTENNVTPQMSEQDKDAIFNSIF